MSVKRKYDSVYGSKQKLTGEQFIVEIMINRQATKKKVVLPNLFWKDPDYIKWTREMKKQLARVHGLVRLGYSADLIISVLMSPKFASVYSLYYGELEYALREANREAKAKEEVKSVKSKPAAKKADVSVAPFRRRKTGKNKLARLREEDGKKASDGN